MINWIKGASVQGDVQENYIVSGNHITANVNADKIQPIIEHFMELNKDNPLFLFIEVPSNLKDEPDTETRHKDVYYLDGLSADAFRQLLKPLYEILIHDGLSAFGIGNPFGDEIGKYKYNIMQLFCRPEMLNQYSAMFQQEHIPETKHLVTAWDTFNEHSPGICNRYTDSQNRTIYDIIKTLTDFGLYKAEQREE